MKPYTTYGKNFKYNKCICKLKAPCCWGWGNRKVQLFRDPDLRAMGKPVRVISNLSAEVPAVGVDCGEVGYSLSTNYS